MTSIATNGRSALSPMPAQSLNGFDALRVLGAVLVLYGHAYPLSGNAAPGFLGNHVQTIGVKIFFVISGYLIARSWLGDANPRRFAAKRFLRIFPGLAANVLLTALVFGALASTWSLADYLASPGVGRYLRNLALYPVYDLPGVFENNVYRVAVNGSLWSLPIEVLMYCTVPLFVTRRERGGWLLQSLWAAIVCGLGVWYVRVHPLAQPVVVYGSSVGTMLDVAGYFQVGALYALVGADALRRRWPALALLAGVAATVDDYVLGEVLLLLLLPYVVLAFGRVHSRVVGRVLGRHDLSYGLYLYGFPVQQWVASQWRDASAWQNFALALPLTALLAAASWVCIERPALRLKPRSAANARSDAEPRPAQPQGNT
jgi:peptidoglycan/LPS O-acetylase OafA/YrhL